MNNDIVLYHILLNIDINNLINIAQINKRIYKIYSSDYFWTEYYHKYINVKYEIEPHLKVRGSWKKAFLRNYSEPKTLTTKDIPSIWNRVHVTEFCSRVPDMGARYQNYINIKSCKDKQMTWLPFIPKSDESLFAHSTEEPFDPDKHLWIERGYKNPYGHQVKLLRVNVYPYHHRLVFDNMKWLLGRSESRMGKYAIHLTYGCLFFSIEPYQMYESDWIMAAYYKGKKYIIHSPELLIPVTRPKP